MSNLPALLEFLGLHKVNRELKINLDIGLQDGFLSWRSSGFFLSLTNLLADLLHAAIVCPFKSDAKTFYKSWKRCKIRLFLHTSASPNSAEIRSILQCFSILFLCISIVPFSALWEEFGLLKYQGAGILQSSPLVKWSHLLYDIWIVQPFPIMWKTCWQ